MDVILTEKQRPALLSLLRASGRDSAGASRALSEFSSWSDDEWAAFVACASYHGVLGVVAPSLLAHPRLPASVREAASRRVAIDELWQEHLTSGLEAAAGALTGAGIRVCALKGPALAARLYPRGTTRHCLDIDLLVAAEDFARTREALVRAGYEPERGVSADYLKQHSHAIGFARENMAPVEIHFRAYAGFGVVLPASFLLDRAHTFRLGSADLLVPSAEEEFIYLAVHAAGHSFIRLVWLYDLALLIASRPGLDWNAVASRARTFGVLAVVAYTLRLLDRWLGMSPENLPAPLEDPGWRARAADRLLGEVSRPQPVSMRDNLGGLIFTSLLCDRVSSGAWLLQHHIGRSAKRKLRALAPSVLPERWSA